MTASGVIPKKRCMLYESTMPVMIILNVRKTLPEVHTFSKRAAHLRGHSSARNAFFREIGPPTHPLVTLIMLNLTPS